MRTVAVNADRSAVRSGFTLTELTIVVTMIGVMVAASAPSFRLRLGAIAGRRRLRQFAVRLVGPAPLLARKSVLHGRHNVAAIHRSSGRQLQRPQRSLLLHPVADDHRISGDGHTPADLLGQFYDQRIRPSQRRRQFAGLVEPHQSRVVLVIENEGMIEAMNARWFQGNVPLLRRSSAGRNLLPRHCLFQAVAHRSEKCGLTSPRGFSMLEMIVAMVVLGIALAGLLPLAIQHSRQVKTLEGCNPQTGRWRCAEGIWTYGSDSLGQYPDQWYITPSSDAWAKKLCAAALLSSGTASSTSIAPLPIYVNDSTLNANTILADNSTSGYYGESDSNWLDGPAIGYLGNSRRYSAGTVVQAHPATTRHGLSRTCRPAGTSSRPLGPIRASDRFPKRRESVKPPRLRRASSSTTSPATGNCSRQRSTNPVRSPGIPTPATIGNPL